VTTVIKSAKEDLLKALRKELSRVEVEVGKAGGASVEWAAAWRRRKEAFTNNEGKLKDRVAQLSERAAALRTDPGPLKSFDRLVRFYREKFSTDSWAGLGAVNAFADSLLSVQSEVNGLLFRHAQAYHRELESLRNEYLALLPHTPPPSFEDSVDGEAGRITLNKTYQQLYCWALGGFRARIADCRRRKEKGQQWRDQTSAHTSWRDIEQQVVNALQAVNGTADFRAVCKVGDKVLRMLNGFGGDIGKTKGNGLEPMVYDDPLEPPDFDDLKKKFERGKVLIKVEPRKAAAEIG
jgi:hypothetical protein